MSIVDLDKLPAEVHRLRKDAGERAIGCYSSGHLLTRKTTAEARDYYHYIVHDNGDWEGAEHIVNIRLQGGGQSIPSELIRQMKERHMAGIGSFPLVGSYDEVTTTMERLSEAGLDGMAIGLVNYIDEFPVIRDEILPRLERVGLREPASRCARPSSPTYVAS